MPARVARTVIYSPPCPRTMRRRAAETGAPARGDVNLMRILPFVVLPLLGLSLTVWGCETRASQQARPPDALSLDVVAEAPRNREIAGGDDALAAAALEEIAGDLFLDEFIVGFVVIEGVDHPIAIAPRVR